MFVVLRITFNKLNNNYNETVDFANDFVSLAWLPVETATQNKREKKKIPVSPTRKR